MNEIEKRARELLDLHADPIPVAVEDGRWFMVREQDALDAIVAALATTWQPQGFPAEFQKRTNDDFGPDFGPWENISEAEYHHLRAIIGEKNYGLIARTSLYDETPAWRDDGWPTQIRALYTAPPSESQP